MNRPPLFLLVKLRVDKDAHFGFSWPLPIFIVLMLADMVADITDLALLFSGKKHGAAIGKKGLGKWMSVGTVNTLSKSIYSAVSGGMVVFESWELVSVETDGVLIRVRVV